MRLSLFFIAVLFAGCVGDAPEPQAPSTDPEVGPGVDVLGHDRPTWSVGDWWTYAFPDGEQRTWVVTEVSDHYVVDIDAEDFAFTDAALSDISTIGQVSLDLDGAQGGTPVAYFDWPLTDGKTWAMDWDGMAFTATASVTSAGATIEAVSDGVVRTYTYDAASGWFGSMESQVDGSIQWSMQNVASGTDYGGSYMRYQIHDEQQYVFDAATGQQTPGDLTVPAEASDIWYDVDVSCTGPGMIHYVLSPPDPMAAGLLVSSACPVDIDSTATLEAVEGTWQTVLDAQGMDGTLTVIVRTLQVYSL